MHDQASHLRQIVLRANRQAAAEQFAPPRLIVVASGQHGVGCTTVAVNLAIALAEHGCRTVLVDADVLQPDAAALCGCSPSPSLGDVLAGRNDIHAALQLAPGGVQLVAGVGHGRTPLVSEKALARLTKQIHSLGPHADVVVVDVGHGLQAMSARFWKLADSLLLVTSPEAAAVMDSYATIKTMLSQAADAAAPQLLVNFAASDAEAADVHRRIDQSCQRFLGISLELTGALPRDEAAGPSARIAMPLVLSTPQSPLAIAIEHIAAAIAAERSTRAPRSAA